MSDWAPKRFWKEAQAVAVDGGFAVHLDGRAVKTPAKVALVVPTQRFACRIAAEWDAQEGAVNPASMPLTRLANAAIDKVAVQFDEVASMLAEYGASDLICYRAAAPEELVARQAQAWDPLIAWSAEKLNAPLIPVQGVMFQSQPATSLDKLAAQVRSMTPFELSAFHDLVSMSGSLILAFAVVKSHLSATEAWALSRVDECWQQEQWGVDEEAEELAEHKRRQFELASEIFDLLV